MLVLVGVTAVGLADRHATALEAGALGVELQADLVEQLLAGSSLGRPDWTRGAELAGLTLMGLAILGLQARLAPLAAALAGAGLAAATVGLSFLAFSRTGLLLDPTATTVTGLAVYVVSTALRFAGTDRQRRHIRRAFERYLAPAVVERLVVERGSLALGGQTRELTLLFADIRGFTSVAELLDAQALIRLVNIFMTPMAEAVLASGGTVDKFMGDAIMAFWNAPLDTPAHERQACQAALAMQAALPAINARLRAEGILSEAAPALGIGIGLNTGPCAVGNMGSEQRFDYSAIGDPVNLASRLEGLCRFYDVAVVLGEATATAVPGLPMAELDVIQVKGKRRPERVFTLLGGANLAGDPQLVALIDAQARLLVAYRAGHVEAAAAALDRARSLDADGRLAGVHALYARRLAELRGQGATADPGAVTLALRD